MVRSYEQLDRRFDQLRALAEAAPRPSRGWIKAIREALGMTTAQLAKRLGVAQPRVVELEQGEASGNVTVRSLERAAEALGCRLVYALIPEKPLGQALLERASLAAERQFAAVEQTMRLEAQAVTDKKRQKEAYERLVQQLLQQPARLWDEP